MMTKVELLAQAEALEWAAHECGDASFLYERAHELRTQAAAMPDAEPMLWRPIESAPLDNKHPLLIARFVNGKMKHDAEMLDITKSELQNDLDDTISQQAERIRELEQNEERNLSNADQQRATIERKAERIKELEELLSAERLENAEMIPHEAAQRERIANLEAQLAEASDAEPVAIAVVEAPDSEAIDLGRVRWLLNPMPEGSVLHEVPPDQSAKIARLAKALDEAAYALFQIKRMVGVTDEIKAHAISAHQKACAVLDSELEKP